MPSQLRLGCRVSGAVGPLQNRPNVPTTDPNGTRRTQRRTRMRYHGWILRSDPNCRWTVYWENVQVCSCHPGNILKYENSADNEAFSRLDVDYLIRNRFVGDQLGLDGARAPTPTQTQEETPATTAETTTTTVVTNEATVTEETAAPPTDEPAAPIAPTPTNPAAQQEDTAANPAPPGQDAAANPAPPKKINLG